MTFYTVSKEYLSFFSDKFFSQVCMDKVGTGCWEWTGGKTGFPRGGYGYFTATRGIRGGAHIYAYRLLIGDVPDGLQLDHLCRNKVCVNPYHLETVTNAENVRRGFRSELSFDD